MSKSSTNIIVIEDDQAFETHSSLFYIKEKYESVNFFKSIQEGLDFLKEHLSKKNIIILDYQLSGGRWGNDVLHTIRTDISKLVPVIFWTANTIKEISSIISDNAFAVVSKTDSIDALLNEVQKAEKELNFTIEGALEEWLVIEKENSNKPYLIQISGKEFTLENILYELRHQTDLGQKFEKNLLMLTIDLLLRRKEKI